MNNREPMKRFFVVLSLAALAYGSGDDLAQHATIRRDTYGVPHITGDSEEAAAFAYGYAVSEDHFASLARLFLRAQGRQAEFLGSAFLEDDIRIRRLGIRELAERQFGLLPPLQQAVLDAYAQE